MTAPIYTATAGPADPKAPFVAKFYTVVTSLLGLATVASTFHLITTEQATAISNTGTSLVGTVGTIVGLIASFRTNKQLKNGTFDKAPDPVVVAPPISTAQQIADAIPNVLQAAADKQAEVDLIKSVAANTFGQLPVVGGLAKDLINSIPSDLHLP